MTHEELVNLAQDTDTKLDHAYSVRFRASIDASSASEALHRLAGDERALVNTGKRDYKGDPKMERSGPWGMTIEAVIKAGPKPSKYGEYEDQQNAKQWAKLLKERKAALRIIEEQTTIIRGLDAIYVKHMWPRFYIVSGGHIHSTTDCFTCTYKTRFGWLPDLSGLSEKDAVAQHGARLCTFCYPSAPVEWTDGRDSDKNSRRCPGSGQYVDATPRSRGYRTTYGKCEHCGDNWARTATGKLPAHDKPMPVCEGTGKLVAKGKVYDAYRSDNKGTGRCSACNTKVPADKTTKLADEHLQPKPKKQSKTTEELQREAGFTRAEMAAKLEVE